MALLLVQLRNKWGPRLDPTPIGFYALRLRRVGAACRFVCGSRVHYDPLGAVVSDGEGGGSEGVGESEGTAVRDGSAVRVLRRGDGERDRFAVSLDRKHRLHALGDILAIIVEDLCRRRAVHGDDAIRPDAICQGQDVGLQCADDSIDLRLRRLHLCFIHEMQSGGHDDGGKHADDGDDHDELHKGEPAAGLSQFCSHFPSPFTTPQAQPDVGCA